MLQTTTEPSLKQSASLPTPTPYSQVTYMQLRKLMIIGLLFLNECICGNRNIKNNA